MELHNLLGDGQAKARAPRAGGAGAVQAEELLKDALQLLRRDGPPLIMEAENDRCAGLRSGDLNLRPRRAVMAGVAQQVVKHPGQLVRVAGIVHPGRQVQGAGELLLREHGLKLADHLLEHAA